MQVTKTEIDALNAKLTVVVEPQDYEEGVQKQLKDIRRRANIPGFRPGMVPQGLVKKMYGKAVLGEEVNKAINEGIFNYIKEQDLNILGEPMPNDEETPQIDWDIDTTFTFVFDIAVAPELNVDFTDKDQLTFYDIKVSDEDVDNQVRSYASRFGKYEQVDQVEEHDMVKGLLEEQKEGGLKKEDAVLMPAYVDNAEFKQNLVGAKKGDVVVFNSKKVYEGKEQELASLLGISKDEASKLDTDFALTINEITRHIDAEVNQDLFDKVYGVGSVADEAAFRARVADELKANLKQDSDYKFGIDAKAAVMDKLKDVQFPEDFLKRWLLQTQDKKKAMTAEELDKEFPQMLEDLKWHLAKDKIATANELKVETEELKDYAKLMTRMQFMQYGLSNVEDSLLEQYADDMLKNEDQVRGIYDRVLENKVYASIREHANVKNEEITREDFGKLFE